MNTPAPEHCVNVKPGGEWVVVWCQCGWACECLGMPIETLQANHDAYVAGKSTPTRSTQ